jgi:surface protein
VVSGVGGFVAGFVLTTSVLLASGFVLFDEQVSSVGGVGATENDDIEDVSSQGSSEAEEGFYRTQEGIIKCPRVEPGNAFESGGKTYTAADNQNDDTLISNDKRICTTHVTDMGGAAFEDPYVNTSYGNITDIATWDTSNVNNMAYTFSGADSFNQDIGSWNTSRVTEMQYMFYDASAFNQDIGSWDTSSITGMGYMFEEASRFRQNISSWCVKNISSKPESFDARAGFEGQTSLQPNWGTTSGCS